MTNTITDPWVQRQAAAGLVPERARGLDRADVANRYNRVHGLAPDDHDYLYSPRQAQRTALALVGIDLPDDTRIVLTDGVAVLRGRAYVANYGQIEAAAEGDRLVTGESISADALIQALPWE